MWYSHGFPTVFLGDPIVFLWFANDPEATVINGSLTESDGKTQRLTLTDRSLTETDGSLTDMHGSGGQWGRRRWAAVRWILGLCWGRCPGMLLCRCAGVHVCQFAGDRGGVPIYRCANASVDFAMISLQLSYVFAIIIL